MKSKDKSRLKGKLKSGGQVKHGGYSYLVKGELPENRKYILRYLTAAREGLVRDLGPTEEDLTTAQLILIDRVVSKLGVVRCIEEYVREHTVMVGENVAPALGKSYLAYSNSVRLDLCELGMGKRAEDQVPNVQAYIKQFDEEKAKKGEKT